MNRMHGIIFAYEQRGELRELTERRTAASMPFGGRYRAVDFALSNLLNAGVTDVGMVLHGRYQSMLDHVGSGKVWDMSRKRGGLHLLPPFNYLHEWGVTPFRGKMEALAGVRDYLNETRQDYVVLMEGDLVANLPLADILEQHIRTHADITAVCGDDSFATENGTYFEKDPDGRIREVLFNMHQPRGYRSLDVFVMSTDLLRSLVDECQARDQYSFRRDVLQAKQDLLHLQSYTTTNEICFPAGILQYPFFDMNADDAFNYGAIGVVIGHEMTHGFDDQGRQYDKDGNLKDWWTEEDAKNFEKRADVMVAFFDSIEVAPGVHANGRMTLGENIADHGGLQVSYQAFKKATAAAPLEVKDGFTPEQRFFLAYANVWANNTRPEAILQLTKIDVHSLGKWRVDAALPHIAAWYDAFGITEKDPMYVPVEERISIW